MTTSTFPQSIFFVSAIKRNSLDSASVDRWYASPEQYTSKLVELGYLNEGESLREDYYEPEEAILEEIHENGETPTASYRRADGREVIANEDGTIFFPQINITDLDENYYSDFSEGFDDEMPDDYCRKEDGQSDCPWCAPWSWYSQGTNWYSNTLSAYEAGRSWAEEVRDEWESVLIDEGNKLTEEEIADYEIALPHVKIILPTNRSDYFHWYDGQFNPQNSYIEIDPEDGTMIADWNGEIGNAIPFSVYYNRIFRFSFPSSMPLTQVRGVMREIAPLAERICEGYSTDFSMAKNNTVGVLNDDARDALSEIESILEHV